LILHLDEKGLLDGATLKAGSTQHGAPAVSLTRDAREPAGGSVPHNTSGDFGRINGAALFADSASVADQPEPESEPAPPPAPGSALEIDAEAEQSIIGRFPSLTNAYDEPVSAELASLMESLYDDLSSDGARIGPELAAYVEALIARLNSQGQPYLVRLRGPEVEDVRRRAVRAHALLVSAGLRPWLLEVFGERGSPSVNVDFAF
jgi:hypothetical protein